ncbi:tetratricopeptide repeat protein [Candidatus Sumerlaeota bacterium]|nr:tetratricopeptide repeat protein [Candidatus Sumerlaeota bacterium]
MSEIPPDSPPPPEEPPTEVPPTEEPPVEGETLLRTTDISATHIVCPHCETANRLNRATCVHCGRDISMLRVIANKARHHFNTALEHAERSRWEDAIVELRNCLDLDAHFVSAWNVLGTCLAKLERFDEAREAWERALAIDPRFSKAHDYLGKVEHVDEARRFQRRLRRLTLVLILVLAVVAWQLSVQWGPQPELEELRAARELFVAGHLGESAGMLEDLLEGPAEGEVRAAATALLEAIDGHFHVLMTEIDIAQSTGDWRRGLSACARLLALEPQGNLRELTLHHRAVFAGRLVEEADAQVAALETGEGDPAALLERLSEIASLMPTQVLRNEIGTLVTRTEAVQVTRRAEAFEATLARVLSEAPEGDALARLIALRDLLGEWSDQPLLGERIAEAANDLARETSDRWTDLSAAPTVPEISSFAHRLQSQLASAEFQPDQAQRAEQAFPDLMGPGGLPTALVPLRDLLADAEGMLPRLHFEIAWAATQAIASQEAWGDLLAALATLDMTAATEAEVAEADALRQRASEAWAAEREEWATDLFARCLAEDQAFETLTVDAELAREIAEGWEEVVERVPSRLFSTGFLTDYSLFYAARGWEALGEPERAIPLYERIVREHPGGDHAATAADDLARLQANRSSTS